MTQTLWVFLLEGATAPELDAFERFRRIAETEGAPVIEVETLEALEDEHAWLLEDGWILAHIGTGNLRKISTYVRG